MKHCLICGHTYADESLRYCLADGSPLSPGADPEATLIRAELPAEPAAHLEPQLRPSSSPFRGWIIYPAVCLLMFLLGAGAGWAIYKFNKPSAPASSSLPSDMQSSGTATPAYSTRNNPPSRQASPAQNQQAPEGTAVPESLSGTWHVLNTVDKSSYQSFNRMRIGYRLRINQTGDSFTADGEKLSENGVTISPEGRVPIHLTGVVGSTVTARFTEEGARRKTSGSFEWKLDADGNLMTGIFVSTAANSSGTSIATKER